MADVSIIKNKYRIVHRVGRGGMGNVYEVVHEGLGTTYALKQLHLEFEHNPEIASRFRHEAQMMARLQHPNIVRVFDIDSEPGFGTYLLMELIRGVDLGRMLRTQGRLKYTDTLQTGLAIASALDTAHRAGLVHRDIKPGNILIEEGTARAVVTDFGIAKQVEADGEENVTRTGSFIGTYRYCSPEQIRNEKGVKIDGRADIYSLGVVLYEMYSGKKFLDGMSEMQIAHHVGFQNDWTPPLEYPEPPPREFQALIERCLTRDRDQRPTAAEVIKAIEQCIRSAVADETVTAGPAAPADDMPPRAEVDVIRERETVIVRQEHLKELAPDVDLSEATRAFDAAESLRAEGALAEAVTKYREAGTAYRHAIIDAEQDVAAHARQAIEQLRAQVDPQSERVQQLQQELAALDVPAGDRPVIADLDAQVGAIRQAEDAGQLDVAQASLEALRDQLATVERDCTALLRTTFQASLATLQDRWRDLRTRAGDFATEQHAQPVDEALRVAETLLSRDDWPGCRQGMNDGAALLEQVERTLRTDATAAVDALAQRLGAALDDLAARAGDGPAQTAVQLDAVEAEVGRCLEEGRWHDARSRLDAALAAVAGALDQALRDEQERASHARATVERALEAVDLEAARALAGEDLSAAERAQQAAVEAEGRHDYAVAVTHYQEAARRYEGARERVHQQHASLLDTTEAEVRDLLGRTAEAPPAIVANARSRAQALLDAPRPPDLSARLTAMREAAATLRAALDEAAAFAAAAEQRSAAETREQQVRALGATRRQLRPAERVMKDAAGALDKRQWRAAQEHFAQAQTLFATLEQELQGQAETLRKREAAAAARQQLEALRTGVDLDAARALAADTLERAEAARARATDAETRADYDAATRAFEEAAAEFRTLKERVVEQQIARFDEEQRALEALLPHAANAPAEIVGPARSQAQALVSGPRPDNLTAGITALERARAALTAALEEGAVFAQANDARTIAEAAQRRIGDRVPKRQQRSATSPLKEAAAAMKQRQWGRARERYEAATAALDALERNLSSQAAAVPQPAAATADGATQGLPARAPLPAATAAAPTPGRRPGTVVWVGGGAAHVAATLVAAVVMKIGPFAPSAVPKAPASTSAKKVPPPPEGPVGAPPAPPVPVPRIASFDPSTDTVAVPEGKQQAFSIALEGKPADGKLPIEWRLGDDVVAKDVAQFDYRPDFNASAGAPRTLQVAVAKGTEAGQSHSWTVNVEDVNRRPVLRSKSPAKAKIEVPQGEKVTVKVAAADDDNDPLTYAWTVDGKAAGANRPELQVQADKDHTVAVSVSDGKDAVADRWQIAALKPSPFELEVSPPRIGQLPFNTRQQFAFVVPSNVPARDLRYTWTVDGKTVSDARTFDLKDYDAKMVRREPVSVVGTATNAQGQKFSHKWDVTVLPPAPEIAKASPPSGRVEASGGQAAFSLQSKPPLGNQTFKYVYEVDGKPAAPSRDGRFTFRPTDDGVHVVSAHIEDNYRQSSSQKIKWTVESAGIVAKVQDWLKEYERAWNAKDVRKLGQLRGLDANLVAQLEESLQDKLNLRVKFSNLTIKEVGKNQAVASYRRLDEWTGAKDGRDVSRTRGVEQTFRLNGSKLTATESGDQ